MKLLSHASLRQMLTLPYIVLVLLAAGIIGALSYRAGSDAVDRLSDHLLTETVNRIAQAVENHVAGSEAVLETAFPPDIAAPVLIEKELDELRTRFWLATSVHRDPNNYAYYGDRRGHFFGLWRFSEQEAELRVRTDDSKPRALYRYSRIRGDLGLPTLETRSFDPRERPWYKAGQATTNQTWTAIYIDFRTLELVSTRARRVNNAAGQFEGVVATDLSLEHLTKFLRKLKLTPNGFAFIAEPDGNIVATSRGPHLRKGPGEENTRLNAAQSEDPWLVATYQAVRGLIGSSQASGATRTSAFAGPDGATAQAGYTRLRDKAGLDWIVAVAVPRSDFMHDITTNVQRTALLALLACGLIVAVGFIVLNVIARDLRRLAHAARDVGEGKLDSRIPVERKDEIGDLARSFAHMQNRMLTDRLTGIANREAIVRRIEDRILRHRRQGDAHPFAVLFVDLNQFKQVNDRFGHDVGDRVLIEIGQRLTENLRGSDLAARIGGDEFIVLLDNVANRNDAAVARDKLERVLAQPLQALKDIAPELATFAAGAAIGMALCPEEGHDLETLLKRADEDMYRRKQARNAARGGY
ncbi:MAG: diguanylate cyclase [Betaproteobacteria bacterium]|nr:diguanylate cyclase [Betaproteobacteria bacterium]